MSDMSGNKTIRITTDSPEGTIEFGRKIAAHLKGGEVISLTGPLGSGKTHLIKGIALGLDLVDSSQVNSPTFTLVNEYLRPDARFDIYHIDAYRIDSVDEFERLGFDELCYPGSVVLIEWADKVEAALNGIDTIEIKLSHIEENKRQICLCEIAANLYDQLK